MTDEALLNKVYLLESEIHSYFRVVPVPSAISSSMEEVKLELESRLCAKNQKGVTSSAVLSACKDLATKSKICPSKYTEDPIGWDITLDSKLCILSKFYIIEFNEQLKLPSSLMLSNVCLTKTQKGVGEKLRGEGIPLLHECMLKAKEIKGIPYAEFKTRLTKVKQGKRNVRVLYSFGKEYGSYRAQYVELIMRSLGGDCKFYHCGDHHSMLLFKSEKGEALLLPMASLYQEEGFYVIS